MKPFIIKEINTDGGCIKIFSDCGNIKKSIIKSSIDNGSVIVVTEKMDAPGVYNIDVDKMTIKQLIEKFFVDDSLFNYLLREYL